MGFEAFSEDGKVGGVAHCHGDDVGIWGEGADVGGEGLFGEKGAEFGIARELGEPFGTGINDGDLAAEGEEEAGEGLRTVAGAKEYDGPGGMIVGFEKEFNDPATGHVDVGLEVPFDEVGVAGGSCRGEEGLGFGDGPGFDFSAADGSGVEALRCDKHFGADVLRGRCDDVHESNGDEGVSGGEEVLKIFPVIAHWIGMAEAVRLGDLEEIGRSAVRRLRISSLVAGRERGRLCRWRRRKERL